MAEAPAGSGLAVGDTVVGIVWGVKQLDGRSAFAASRNSSSRVAPALGVAGVLLEPASVLAKAWGISSALPGRRENDVKTVLLFEN